MRYCIRDGCVNLAIDGSYYCKDHQRKKKRQGKFQSANKSFYRKDAWRGMRDYIYQRDGARCRECKKFTYGKSAHVHHVIPISEDPSLKLDEENLILLCPKCHAKIENETKIKSPPSIFQKYF